MANNNNYPLKCTFRCLVYEEKNRFVAACLDLDIIEEDTNRNLRH